MSSQQPSRMWNWLLVAGCGLTAWAVATTSLPGWGADAASSYLQGASGMRLDEVRAPFSEFVAYAGLLAWLPLLAAGLLGAGLGWIGRLRAADAPRCGLRLACYGWGAVLAFGLAHYHGSAQQLTLSMGGFFLGVFLPAINLPSPAGSVATVDDAGAWRFLLWSGFGWAGLALLGLLMLETVAATIYGWGGGGDFALLTAEKADFVRFFCCELAGHLVGIGLLVVALARLGRAGFGRAAWWTLAVGAAAWLLLDQVFALRSGVYGPNLLSLAFAALLGLPLFGLRDRAFAVAASASASASASADQTSSSPAAEA